MDDIDKIVPVAVAVARNVDIILEKAGDKAAESAAKHGNEELFEGGCEKEDGSKK